MESEASAQVKAVQNRNPRLEAGGSRQSHVPLDPGIGRHTLTVVGGERVARSGP